MIFAGTGIGLFYGCVLGLCVAPLWMMLQLPIRIGEIAGIENNRLCGWALAAGASLAALCPMGFFPDMLGYMALGFAGVFTGMIAAALVEAVEVIPVLFDRLSISTDFRFAAFALALGKGTGAILACFLVKG